MTNQLLKYAILAVALSISGLCSADVLLEDTFADADRTETDLPNESAVWISHPTAVTMGTGSLAYGQTEALGGASGSQKMWTYFTPDGSPVSLGVGEQLVATIKFTPRTALYETTSKNFRFGLFNDPTNAQVLEDINSDSGGTGDPWADSTGYAVQIPLSSGPSASNASLGKRIPGITTSLLGSGSAYPTLISGGASITATLNTLYTLMLKLDRLAAEEMEVTFEISDVGGVISTHSITDSSGIYTNFDQLFFRFSSASGTADLLDFHSIKIEHIVSEEPPYEGPPVGILHTFSAFQSCRTDVQQPDTNVEDSSKLSVRNSPSDGKAAKSWIKFNIGDLDVTNLKAATLTVALQEPEGGSHTVDVSAVNDDCLENFFWTDDDITWNNAPGNLTTDLGLLDSTETTFVGTINIIDGIIGQKYEIDVLSIIEADTDGVVQFVLHNSDVLMNFCTHDHSTVNYRPVLSVIETPPGADYPYPWPGQTVQTSLAVLKWTNPEPNLPSGIITCDVYLGKDPNRPEMDKVTLAPGAESVAINSTNFPNFAPLADKETYYWLVDCYDSTAGLIPGLMWYFYVNNNEAPVVDAGPDQVTWGLPKVINLNGTTSDDDLPDPPKAYTVLWTQVSGPAVVIDPNDQDDISVNITEAGDYTFKLTADDTEKQTSDTVRIVVGATSCQASHLFTGLAYDPGDFNQDCMVNMEDFAELMASNWLICTDEQTFCE